MKSKHTIPVWTSEATGTAKAALPTLARQAISVVEVETDLISENLATFLKKFYPIVESQDEASPFVIDEIELALAVNAKGGIELLGKLEAGAQVSIRIKLKKKPA